MLIKNIKLFGKILMIFVSVSITLVALEIFIRWQEKVLPISKYQEPNIIAEISEENSLRKRVLEKGISASTFNIYYYGESTMWGEPYVDTIPILIEKMLMGRVNGKELKWINMASPGININESRRRINQIVKQKDVFFPSLIIVYSGHNEFLPFHGGVGFSFSGNDNNPIGWTVNRSRLAYKTAKILGLYKLEIDDRKFFDTAIVEPDKYNEILDNYINEIKSIIMDLKANNVPLIVSTVAGNYADFEPNRSVFTADESEKTQFKELMDFGLVAERDGDNNNALNYYQKALKIDKNFAETYYRSGKIYQKLGQYDDAWEAYSLAVDKDMMPIRAVTIQNNFIKNIPEDDNTKVLDVVPYLRLSSENKLIGYNLMADGHHPNLEGHRLIAELFANKIASMYPKNTKALPFSNDDANKIFNENGGLYNAYISRADWIIRMATWRYDPTKRLTEVDDYLTKAKLLRDDDYYWFLTKMTLAYLRKNVIEANDYYQKSKNINPKATKEYIRDGWINQIIIRALD